MNARDAGLPVELPGARLRRLRATDIEAFQAYRAMPELARYQGWTPQSDADALTFLQVMARAPLFQPGEWIQLGIADACSDRLLGDVGLFLAADGRSGEVGFTLHPDAQGRGLATASVAAAVQLFFAQTEAERMLASTDTRNTPSLRLLQRLGFDDLETRDAIFRGEPCRESHLSLSRDAASPYAYGWEFEVRPGCEAEFEQHYGPDGSWARLFRQSPGYVGTLLLRDRGHPNRYVTIDRWRSAAEYNRFQSDFAAAYRQLDAECERLTVAERALGEWADVPGAAGARAP
jgi:RimJ/RimL family protein N-acetyltransferase/heme-degrading monooxygenase HmoA